MTKDFDKFFQKIFSEMANILVAPERWLVSVSDDQDIERKGRVGGKYKKSENTFINNFLERPDIDSSYKAGGKYFDVKSGEILNEKIFENGYIDTSNGPKMNVENEITGEYTPVGKKVLVNLLTPKNFPWKWVDEKNESKNINRIIKKGEGKPISSIPIISVESGKIHVYAIRVEFKNPVVLKNYPDRGEPRLRPTTYGSVKLGNEYGRFFIYSSDKEHIVYDLIVIE